MDSEHVHKRLLAVDLSSRGFGYAIFDAKRTLVDWGFRRVSGNKNAACLAAIRSLVRWYTPDVLVLERYGKSRRPPRTRLLADQIGRLAVSLDVQVVAIGHDLVRRTVGRSEKATKDQIAARVADCFPETRKLLPPKRKIWMSEDQRINVFDAVALGVTAMLASRGMRR